jgi:transposase
LTLLGTREGIPIVGTVQDGNASDKRLNADMLAALGDDFAPEQLRRLVYVADSALVTGPNLATLAAQDLQFVSRLPETFGAAAAAKAAAWADNAWIPVGRIGVRHDAATYQASEQTGVIDDRPYRLVVYHSSHLDRRKAKTLDRTVARAGHRLVDTAAPLAGTRFACAADAEAAAQTWRATATWHAVQTTVVAETVVGKRPTRGRPRADAPPPPTTTVYRVQATVGDPDPARIQAALARAATFVLITTLPAPDYDPRRLLEEYKGQTVIEQRFHFLKDPVFVDALFVHKPERVEALGYVLLLACLVLSLLERRVRQGPPLPTPSRGALARPTGQEILHHLRPLIVTPVDAFTRELFIPVIFAAPVTTILAAAGFTETIYTQVPRRNTS